jgi:hypothetical protein
VLRSLEMDRRGQWQRYAAQRSLFRRILADQIGIAAVLLIAFFPTVTFLGHWDEIFTPTDDVAPAPLYAMTDLNAELAEQAEHASHCHTNLASCSAQPLPAGVGLLLTQEALVGPPPQTFRAAPIDEAAVQLGPSLAPPSPPPRLA